MPVHVRACERVVTCLCRVHAHTGLVGNVYCFVLARLPAQGASEIFTTNRVSLGSCGR